MTVRKLNVLFLCSANSCRSQMAEAFLRKYGGGRFEAYSAGLEPSEIHPLARRVMEEAGLDLSWQHSKGIERYLGKLPVDFLIAVCSAAARNCPTAWPGAPKMQRLSWPLDDPAAAEGTEEERLARFRDVRNQIEALVLAWLADQS